MKLKVDQEDNSGKLVVAEVKSPNKPDILLPA